jgi:hypothetical protein
MNRSDIVAAFEQVSGKGMPQGMAIRGFVNACFLHSLFHCAL